MKPQFKAKSAVLPESAGGQFHYSPGFSPWRIFAHASAVGTNLNSEQNPNRRASVLECGGKALRDTALDAQTGREHGLRCSRSSCLLWNPESQAKSKAAWRKAFPPHSKTLSRQPKLSALATDPNATAALLPAPTAPTKSSSLRILMELWYSG